MHGSSMQKQDIETGPRPNAFVRGFVEAAAGLLDIFRARKDVPGTPEDDALALRGDVEEIARDFYAVLPNVEMNAKK
jgi:hypothetical protein